MIRFQDLERFTQADVDAAIARNDPSEMKLVPVTVALVSTDLSAAQKVCVALCSHADRAVRGNALISLGHLARRFRKLDEQIVKPVVERALRDQDAHIRALAKSAADEIHQFLHWQIAGHVYG
jgi:hypothetical protein